MTLASALQEHFTNLHTGQALQVFPPCDCDLQGRHSYMEHTAGTRGAGWGLRSALCTLLCTLQPPFLVSGFSGGSTVRKLRCPVPSSVSVLPASNLGRYHSFANGFLSQTRLKPWGPCN